MTVAALTAPARNRTRSKGGFDLHPATRAMIGFAATAMTAVCLYAIIRAALGWTPELPHLRNIAVMIHVASVLPCVPLGGYLLLTRKGTKRHKALGKVWLGLMVSTAVSAIFIKTGGTFSWLHIFVPTTLFFCCKAIATARRGDIKAHKQALVITFMTALIIPGVFSMIVPGRLMNVMLLG